VRPAALSHANALVANSEFMGKILTEAGYRNVRVIHNGVDTELFRPSPSTGPSKLVLFPVARSRQERKGYSHFVRMARAVHAQLPEVRFRILNDPGDDLIEGTPYLSLPELVEQLRSAYLVVVPGLWDEPFGLVAAEAMSVGRPVVMYDGGGSCELMQNGQSGVLVPRGNVEELTRAVIRLLTDEETARRIGRAARARIEASFQ
jgi:glycosyltransferase involved in cell wall biosynthesis